MKTKYLLLLCVLLGAVSCVKDKSDTGGDPISRITFKEGTGDVEALLEIVSDRHERLVLNAPDVVQENVDKPLTYRWEINYEMVGEGPTLTYDCPTLSPNEGFPCRLMVSNEDGMNWIDFNLRVMTPFERGIFVLSEYKNDTYIAYKRDDKRDGAEKEKFIPDVYNLSNPLFPLGSKPKCIAKHTARGVASIWIGTEDPLRIAKINAQTFEVRNFLSYPREEIGCMISTVDQNGMMFVGGGETLDMETDQDAFLNNGQQWLDMDYPDNYVEPFGINVPAAGGYLMYESNYNFLFIGGGFMLAEYSAIDLTDLTVFDIVELKDGEGLVACETDGGDPVILYINAAAGTQKRRIDAAGSGISRSSAFVSHPSRILAYYSVGNKVFGFNYEGGAELPATPMFTVGSTGDVIRKIGFSPDESRIYVAYEKSSGDMPGCVAAFDVEGDTFTLAWDEQNVAGRIVDILIQ